MTRPQEGQSHLGEAKRSPFGDSPFTNPQEGLSPEPGFFDRLEPGRETMAKMTKKDELMERLAVEMDHIKAGLAELKAKGRKLKLEARLDYEKGLRSFETAQKDLKVRMGEWSKAGEKAGGEVKKGLEQAAKDLKKAIAAAAERLK